MSPNAQLIGFALAICIPSFTALVGVLFSNMRISDLRSHMDAGFAHIDTRFDLMDKLFTERLRRVEEIVDARLTRIEEHIHLK